MSATKRQGRTRRWGIAGSGPFAGRVVSAEPAPPGTKPGERGLTIGPYPGPDGLMTTLDLVVGHEITDETVTHLDDYMNLVHEAVEGAKEAILALKDANDSRSEGVGRATAALDAAKEQHRKDTQRIETLEQKLHRKEEQLAEAKRAIDKARSEGTNAHATLRESVRAWEAKWKELAPEWPGWVELEKAVE